MPENNYSKAQQSIADWHLLSRYFSDDFNSWVTNQDSVDNFIIHIRNISLSFEVFKREINSVPTRDFIFTFDDKSVFQVENVDQVMGPAIAEVLNRCR